MLEFIVPEPAAFLRYAMSKLPDEGGTLVKPDPPGYCLSDGKTFQPLQVEDIDRDHYLFWVANYNVQDVSPPPDRIISVSQTKVLKTEEVMKFENTGHNLSVKDASIDIPDGYTPQEASVNLRWAGGTYGEMYVQIQDKQISALTDTADGGTVIVQLSKRPTSAVPYTIDSNQMYTYAAIIDIMCTLSSRKEAEWQLETYKAIINAYKDQKTRYDTAIEATKIREGLGEIKGKNPFMNRETEKIELKKGCISLLTGQRFEDFDAVNRNVAPHGYPEIDFDEARVDGEYIRRFEQTFEWTNMTYVFYPYFGVIKRIG